MQITAPNEFQGTVIGDVNRRKGIIMGSEQEGDDVIINVSGSWVRGAAYAAIVVGAWGSKAPSGPASKREMAW